MNFLTMGKLFFLYMTEEWMAGNGVFGEEETALLSYNMNDWQKHTKPPVFLFHAIHHFVQQSYVVL